MVSLLVALSPAISLEVDLCHSEPSKRSGRFQGVGKPTDSDIQTVFSKAALSNHLSCAASCPPCGLERP